MPPAADAAMVSLGRIREEELAAMMIVWSRKSPKYLLATHSFMSLSAFGFVVGQLILAISRFLIRDNPGGNHHSTKQRSKIQEFLKEP